MQRFCYILDLLCITRLISNVHPGPQKERLTGDKVDQISTPPPPPSYLGGIWE